MAMYCIEATSGYPNPKCKSLAALGLTFCMPHSLLGLSNTPKLSSSFIYLPASNDHEHHVLSLRWNTSRSLALTGSQIGCVIRVRPILGIGI